jgi:hypothetical protein
VALAEGITLQEHEIQVYACKAEKTLKGIKHEFINDENKVEVPCITGKSGHFLNPQRKYFLQF